ncbi:MAG TPA: ABC transporter ATP-binding protein [Bryobacteraceae bacterium]|nr:ABC transporter ATP-binding protein [Bryobacteraceae bacterium]
MTAIEFTGVSKSFYRHSGRQLLRDHLKVAARGGPKERFYALKDLNFAIARGEGVAIVGSNGAGKSTMLAMMTGLAQPDAGSIRVCGRIGALLQLGAGFHPDLTGIENVRLNAAMLGLTRRRTEELFETIVDFAGIGDFIAEPLRTYSSGMQMRLAFAVAVNLDPEILLVDEVLSVGDHEFQAKCAQSIMALKASGKTMICVSHASSMLERLCERALWLDHGTVMMDGAVREVVTAYEGRR